MKYILIVSHGHYAQGIHSVLDMMVGSEREDIISVSLKDGMASDQFKSELAEKTAHITAGDDILLFGDIIGGSPLVNTICHLDERNLLSNVTIFGGANMPMVLGAAFLKDEVTTHELVQELLANLKDTVSLIDVTAEDLTKCCKAAETI
ncbi:MULTISPECIES: PTS sugar transporter subunit IIA [Enterobacteriaceae]|uniref:PTS sugar transporter subunit IIA n=1 Tax=Enterobacteriaceae TaxID=543 RepID=UPI0006660EAB|nr:MULTISPECIES: hypothetical protein [Enterobacteriaceae]MCS1420301.1 hypothetical protein [Citrobacter portucalensis]